MRPRARREHAPGLEAGPGKGGNHAFPGKGNPAALEEELRRLQAKNKRLAMECDILPLNASIALWPFSSDSSPEVVLVRARS